MKLNALAVFTVLYLLVLYAPIALLPLFAFNSGTIIAFPLQGFTLEWFAALLNTPALHEATLNSLIIAISTAVFSTILGLRRARRHALRLSRQGGSSVSSCCPWSCPR